MSHRNMVWTRQVVNPELEQGYVQVQPESYNYGGTGSGSSNLGVQVAVGVPGNTANVGICDPRNYYESINHEHQHVQNSYPHAGVTSSFVFPTAMYNPSMSTTAVNIYIPQSFGLGNVPPPSLYHQVATGTMDEGSSSGNFGDSASGFIKRKNAVVSGNHHFLHGFAGSSSSAHLPQNPAQGPWNASFQSNCLPNSAASNPPEYQSSNGWPFLEGSSADVPSSFNSMAAHPELIRHGNYVFPACHMGQCNAWTAQAANGIVHGVPQWGFSNAVANPPGTRDMPNGNLQDYQAGHSIHGPLPHFCQNPLHSMQAPQVQVPHQQFLSNNVMHGVNPSATGLLLDPRILALPFNSEHTFGHPMHPPLTNQVNNGVLRILSDQNVTMMDRSRIYEAGHVMDEHRDMRLDVDNMTYEELVELEEQIGDVSTGLTESYIQENLMSSFYVPGAARLSDQSSELSVENDSCIICQEGYKAEELIGTLDCGHKYHVMCIKQWLMMKNLCPICKTSALSGYKRNG
ncbi:probable E3 ubiquitin-protein ligase ZFP1 [Phragmites australis]|uniref:probable E3 ubiquitin-protein ligase ZFP1 n=1 Tax=Phragmites australis TaxID=29695 RepID=UPI002D765863|nr:probable E3 ubiquitin-protein ligase ZFP1 [Phragmites australis]XP_062232146.1 probable E3 ubiquitin-protein ligase ZFP1 [Phragmites australis]XP_062232148.1 probable E3 ubiquitin-protein ligase ZFP1 [Phragmites australis]XP_062232149.1 probable E3 ubiquitin-protein ligase ZFP1 [Phragmites australis]